MEGLASKRPSPSLVLSMVTLFVALSSTAGALPGRDLVERGDLAKGAVTSRALARGAVRSRAIAPRAVTAGKLAADAVTSAKLAPFSVGAFALGSTTVVSAGVNDADGVEGNPQWTTSATVSAVCPANSVLLGGGVSIADASTFHQVAIATSVPNGDRWEGAISTNTGGLASGRVYAICLL